MSISIKSNLGMNNSKHESQTSGKETMKSVSLRKTKKNIKTQKDKRYEIDNKLTDYCVTIQPVCSDGIWRIVFSISKATVTKALNNNNK